MSVDIVYLGHSAFKIKDRQKTVVTDPYTEVVGKLPRDLEADIVTVSHKHPDHNAVDKVKGHQFVIDGPGEYEVGGISVIGVPTFHDDAGGEKRGANTAYVIEIEGLRIVHLGDLGHKLSQETLEEIGSVDVALVPVGGNYTIDAKTAKEVVAQVDPWIVIPMHYQMNELLMKDIAPVEDFLKEMGKPDVVPIPKLSLSLDKLPTEMQIVVLEKK
jgi:L-ascorbate metabolism protein UlaG (beta-lactamase superfamily)